jgi:hypothetical protein
VMDGGAPQTITGYISYQTDNDWFSFQHPCPGMNCGIQFEWTQPGPSPVDVAFFMLDEDLGLHESFAYTGATPTTSLTSPMMLQFPDPPGTNNCGQCSYAGSTVMGSGGNPYTYFLQIADAHNANWDFSSTGQYSFQISAITPGCPAACAYATQVPCGCYCPATNSCPSPSL